MKIINFLIMFSSLLFQMNTIIDDEIVVYLEGNPKLLNIQFSSEIAHDGETIGLDGEEFEDYRLLTLLETSTNQSFILDKGMLGLPTWSTDGKYLSYGCGFGFESKICLIDFSTIDEINQENINNLHIYKIDVENIINSNQMYEETQGCNFIQSIQWGPNDTINYLCIMTDNPYFSYYQTTTNWVSNETICKGRISKTENDFVYENYFCTDFSNKMISPINNFEWGRNNKFIYLNTVTKVHSYTIFGEPIENTLGNTINYLSVSPNKRYQLEIKDLEHIYLKDFSTNEEKEIFINDDMLKPVLLSSRVSWTSSSDAVYLALNLEGDLMLNYPPENMDIYKIDIDAGKVIKITSCENGCYSPSVRN